MIRKLWDKMDDVFSAWLKGVPLRTDTNVIETVDKPCRKTKKSKPEKKQLKKKKESSQKMDVVATSTNLCSSRNDITRTDPLSVRRINVQSNVDIIPNKDSSIGMQTRSRSRKRKAKEQKEGEDNCRGSFPAPKKFKAKKEQTVRQPQSFDEKKIKQPVVAVTTTPKQIEIMQDVVMDMDMDSNQENNDATQTQPNHTNTDFQENHNPDIKKLYVLLCENNKRYVGTTSKDPTIRFCEHLSGGDRAAEYCRRYAPVTIESVVNLSDSNINVYKAEDDLVLELMEKHGVDNVRGGSYSSVVLRPEELRNIRRYLCHTKNLCFVCQKTGHYARDCLDRSDGGATRESTNRETNDSDDEKQLELALAKSMEHKYDSEDNEIEREEIKQKRCVPHRNGQNKEGGGEPIRLRCERLRKLHSNKIDQSASTFKPLAATATAKKETEHVSNSKKHTQEEWNGFLRYYKCFVCGELGHIEESHQI